MDRHSHHHIWETDFKLPEKQFSRKEITKNKDIILQVIDWSVLYQFPSGV